MHIKLPYFDYLLAAFAKGDASLEKSFGHHVHWGYWEFPEQARLTLEDFSTAAENLSQLIYHAAQVSDSQTILDAGCGFGGTLDSLNRHYQHMDLIGLNIDGRQLLRAREQIIPQAENKIRFEEGNACALPFADNSFDVVLAVECIFHFPSREQFFKEVNRVLKPGGYLALSDFSLSKKLLKLNKLGIAKPLTQGFFGDCNAEYSLEDYRQLAQNTHFKVEFAADITKNTLPTYTYLRSLTKSNANLKSPLINNFNIGFTILSVEILSRMDLLKYYVLAFKKHLTTD
jgi:ubiquinone/menaquinone biosynthesis C-methylase UbiE